MIVRIPVDRLQGEIIGSPYEFDRGNKTKDFPLFNQRSWFTDDSVMTIAVAEALMDSMGKSDEEIREALVASMQKWGAAYPDAGYGNMFYGWLQAENPQPYGSFGNGSAMRVASAGWRCWTGLRICGDVDTEKAVWPDNGNEVRHRR